MRQLQMTLVIHLCLSFSVFPQLPTDLDSLKMGFEAAANDSVKFLYADELFWQWVYKDLEESQPYAEAALHAAELLKDSAKKVIGLNNYAIYFRLSGQFRKGDSVLREAIQISERIRDTVRLSRSYGNLSNVLKDKGDYEESIEADLQSMRFYEALGDSAGIGRCLNNIGNTHFALKHYQKSLTYYRKSLIISKQTQDTFGIAQVLGNIGTCEKHLGNTEQALEAYLESNVYFKKMGYKRRIAFTLNNIGLLYRERGDLQDAEDYLLQSMEILEEKDNAVDMANIFDNLAKTAILQKDYNKGLAYASQAWKRIQEVEARPVRRKIYQSLFKAHAGKNNFIKAYEFQEKYLALNDSLINEGNTQKIQEMEARYEAEAREKEILVLNKDKEIQAQTIAAQKAGLQARNAIILGVLMALGLAIFATISYRQKQLLAQNEKDLAAQKNRELQNQQQMIRMNSIILGEERERRRIAKDLHDGIGSMLAAAKLRFGTLTDKIPSSHETKETYSLLDNTYEEVRRIAHNMMPKALLQLGLIPAVRQLGDFISGGGNLAIHVESLEEWPKLPDHKELLLYRIIQELLNNVQKHANASEAWVQFSYFEGESSIIIEDNGVGFDLETQKKGMGLESLRSRVEYLHGELEIYSHPGKGTVVNIRVPHQTQENLTNSYETYNSG